jgi:hypothetical protein
MVAWEAPARGSGDCIMPDRIPRLNAMTVLLAELATEASLMREHALAHLIVDAMTEARRRSQDIAATISDA